MRFVASSSRAAAAVGAAGLALGWAIAVMPSSVGVPTAMASTPPSTAPGATSAAPVDGTVSVLGGVSIRQYAPTATGNAAPVTSITGHLTTLRATSDLAVTATGALWVTRPAANELIEFAPGASGDVAPAVSITGSRTRLSNPVACAVDRLGHLWVLNDKPSAGTASVTEYAPTAHGNVAPIGLLAGSQTRLFPAGGLAVGSRGRTVWVTHVEAGSGLAAPALQEFATATLGNVAPIRTISGRLTGLDYPAGLTIDAGGELVVANDADRGPTSSLLTFGLGATGDVAPLRSVSGSSTGLVQPSFPALDARGNVWVPTGGSSSVRRFPPSATGNRAPGQLIAGAATRLGNPTAVAVLIAPPSAPQNPSVTAVSRRVMDIRWTAPLSNGGAIIGYRVQIRSSVHPAWRTRRLGRADSYTTTPLTRHRTYFFRVQAFNEAGTSASSSVVSITVN